MPLALVNVAGAATLRQLCLVASDRTELLVNGDFASALAHWLPAAQFHFLPWHIDNLYTELLVERGVLGLALFAALLAFACWSEWSAA